MNKPYFSFVLPSYNASQYLERSLDAILNQTFDKIEVIVVDDCSTDDTHEKALSYSKKDSRVIVIHLNENNGTLIARQSGVEAAKGEYVLFLDPDDYIDADMCAVLQKRLLKSDVDILEFGYIREPAKNVVHLKKEKYGNIPSEIMMGRYPCTLWNKCYKVSLVKEANKKMKSYNMIYIEDSYQSIVYTDMAKNIEYIDDYAPLHYVTGEGMSTTNNIEEKKFKRTLDSVLRLKEGLHLYFTGDEREDLVDNWIRLLSLNLYAQVRYSNNSSFEKAHYYDQLDQYFGTHYLDELFEKEKKWDDFYKPTYKDQVKSSIAYLKGRTRIFLKQKFKK